MGKINTGVSGGFESPEEQERIEQLQEEAKESKESKGGDSGGDDDSLTSAFEMYPIVGKKREYRRLRTEDLFEWMDKTREWIADTEDSVLKLELLGMYESAKWLVEHRADEML